MRNRECIEVKTSLAFCAFCDGKGKKQPIEGFGVCVVMRSVKSEKANVSVRSWERRGNGKFAVAVFRHIFPHVGSGFHFSFCYDIYTVIKNKCSISGKGGHETTSKY